MCCLSRAFKKSQKSRQKCSELKIVFLFVFGSQILRTCGNWVLALQVLIDFHVLVLRYLSKFVGFMTSKINKPNSKFLTKNFIPIEPTKDIERHCGSYTLHTNKQEYRQKENFFKNSGVAIPNKLYLYDFFIDLSRT